MTKIVARTKSPYALRSHQYTLMRAMKHKTATKLHRLACSILFYENQNFTSILEEVLHEPKLATV